MTGPPAEPDVTNDGPSATPAPADRLSERLLWRLLSRFGSGGAAVAAWRLAAAWMRRAARTDAGYEKGRLRVARRTPMPTPRLVKPPAGWSTSAPLVRTRRGWPRSAAGG